MPVHGRLVDSARALDALSRLRPPPAGFVIVVDTAPDASDGALLPPGSQLVGVPFRSGPARARNAGASAASAEVLLFIDADVEVPADTVSRVEAEFAVRPQLAAVFGSYDANPADPGFLSQYRNLLHHFVHQQSRVEASTFWAGLGAVRAGVFHAVGGFDEAFGAPSIEDIELGCRLRSAGHSIRVAKTLQGRHLKRWTAAGLLKTDLLHRGIPWTRLILARGRAPRDLNLDLTARLSTVLAGLALGSAVGCWSARPTPWAVTSVVCVALLVGLNCRFYGFLARRRGPGFAIGCIPWHFLFYVVCGLAASLGALLHLGDRLRRLAPSR